MTADVYDDDDTVIVRIEAPDMRREDPNVELHDGILTLWGESRSTRKPIPGDMALCSAPREIPPRRGVAGANQA